MARSWQYPLCAAITAICLGVPIGSGAQDQEDAGFLERQIQNALGGEGRDVRVIGLEGILSSEASIARIEIADDDGTWLIVRDVVLDWNRLALLRRRLEVEALTIGSIELQRKPLPAPGEAPEIAADPTPTPFSLPELPVAVNVSQLSIGDIDIGETVLGQSVSATMNGTARLEGGEGLVDLDLVRNDGQKGRFSVDAGFENASRRLHVDVIVSEDPGGLIASLSGMPGAPSLDLTIQGDAPISDFTATIDMATDGIDRLDGTVNLREEDAGNPTPDMVVTAGIRGDVAELFLPDYRDFFGRELALDLRARRNPATGVDVEELELATQGMTLSGQIALSPEFVPQLIDLDGRIGNELGLPVVLPLSGPATLVHGADLNVGYDASQRDRFSVAINAEGIMRTDGLLLDTAEIGFDGTLEQAAGSMITAVSGDLDAVLNGFSTTDPALWDAVGDRNSLTAHVEWQDQEPLRITDLDLTSGEDVLARGDVTVSGLQEGLFVINADVDAEAQDLSRFAAISGQPLGGSLDAGVQAEYHVSGGSFDVALSGHARDLSFGQDAADHLLAGDTTLDVAARRTAEGITVDRLDLDGRSMKLNGSLAIAPDGFPRFADITGQLGLDNGEAVELPIPGVKTELDSADLRISYDADTGDSFEAVVSANGLSREDGIYLGQASIDATGTIARDQGLAASVVTANIAASLSDASATHPGLDAILAEGLDLTADIEADLTQGNVRLTGLDAASGDLNVSGSADVTGLLGDDATAQAQVSLQSGPLSRFAALAGQDIGGSLNAETSLTYSLGSGYFTIELDGTGTDLATGFADIDALIAETSQVDLSASRDDTGIVVDRFALDGGVLRANGNAVIAPDFFPRLVDLTARFGAEDGAPVALPIPGQPVSLGSADLSVEYDAAQGDAFTTRLAAQNLIAPNGVTLGRVDVTADGELVRGSDPLPQQIAARLTAEIADASATDPALAAAVSSGAQFSADLDYRASAKTATIRNLRLTSGDLTVSGEADAADIGGENLAVAASLNVDTGSLDRFAPLVGQPIGGSLSADAEAAYEVGTGNFEIDLNGNASGLRTGIPQADAVLAGQTTIALQASQTDAGLDLPKLSIQSPQLSVNASGGMQSGGGTIDLDARLNDLAVVVPGLAGPLTVQGQAVNRGDVWGLNADLQGPGGTTATVSGDVLRPDGTVDLNANGSLPLALANRMLAPRSVDGNLGFDLAVRGAPGLDAVSGSINLTGGRVADPATRLALEGIAATITLANAQANVDLNGNLSTGGQISVSGPVALTGDFAGNLDIALRNLTLVDPRIYEVHLGGDISVDGPLAGGASITGRIDVDDAEIKIPSGLGGAADIPDITHVGETGSSHLTRERAGLIKSDADGAGGVPVAYPLDILISAPQQIFVRGRGLNAELGGQFRIGGTTANVSPQGALELIRGDLDLLGQRLEFDEATISMQGDLVPDLRMVASSSNGTIRAQIVIEGPVTDPEITLSSEPELPEDEVLAQLFFNKPISDLTPLEVAQLAAAVRELSGGSGGLFNSIREGLGVDNLDFSADEEGTTSVTAGKYISERIYSDVTASSDGTTEIHLNYEITKDFKAKAGFDNEGNTGIGISFERDY